MIPSASFELGTVLARVPDVWRNKHKLVEIRNAYALGWAHRTWSRRETVRMYFRAVMEYQGTGHGNKAARRIGQLNSIA